ncbi:MAG TPA: carboxypeptidase regulatory-like domain-containing protein, partial [Pseudomonadota bacterium]|nr:carboxypeptidase regulatory-like domain-containing protein [Pseudomonadota bacterium]
MQRSHPLTAPRRAACHRVGTLPKLLLAGLVLSGSMFPSGVHRAFAVGEQTARLRGTVVEGGTDVPMQGALVTIRGDSLIGGPRKTTADEEGRFDFPLLPPGKYTVTVTASDRAGRAAEPLRLVFWIEATPFTWQGATIYMAMVDRFADGDRGNNAARTAGVDARADYQGGDFQGL